MMRPSILTLRPRPALLPALLCALAAGGCTPPGIALPPVAAPDIAAPALAASTGGLPLAAYARPTGEAGVSLRLASPADMPAAGP
ncbi:hypothetical protein JHL17_20295 [Azospirillum sp. YIM B02556]|uniref:Uncharacterized protein n=1 Tax=Azospirillum endophyticum TaxID=2800326 RepID=A0ABS1F8I9_9PROT|nr:hypothetical protein [Azospirillum endophyticum]MBK1839750.1 hypothetical protein [Azospirillum endophyticum]